MIEEASLKDAATCSAILHEWIYETDWFPNTAPESASEQAMKNRIETEHVYVAKNSDNIDGFVAFSDGYLECLYLTPEARDKGLGARLLSRAKTQNPAGLALWVLEKNAAARRFYAREGFVEVASGDGADNEEGLPDVRMEWQPEEAKNGQPA